MKRALVFTTILSVGCFKHAGEDLVAGIASEASRNNLHAIVDDARIRAASEALVEDLATGALRGLNDDVEQRRLAAHVERLTAALLAQVDVETRERLLPAVRSTLDGAARDVLASALGPRTRRDATRLVAEITETAARKATASIAAGVEADLRPTLRRLFEEDLPLALEASRDPLADIVADATSIAVSEVGRELDHQQRTVRETVTFLERLLIAGGVVTLVGLIVTAVLIYLLRKEGLKAQALKSQVDASEEAMLRLAAAVRDHANSEVGQAIARRMKDYDESPSGQAFQSVLSRNPTVRFKPPS